MWVDFLHFDGFLSSMRVEDINKQINKIQISESQNADTENKEKKREKTRS